MISEIKIACLGSCSGSVELGDCYDDDEDCHEDGDEACPGEPSNIVEFAD